MAAFPRFHPPRAPLCAIPYRPVLWPLLANLVSLGEQMPDKSTNAEVRIRMKKIREIAKGIFDKDERQAVLDLVSDYEKLALPKARRSSGA